MHNLDIPFQPDLTVSAKPLETLRFVFPVEVQRKPDYSEEYDILSSYEAGEYLNDINRKISEYAEPEEEHRGIMTYYHENNSVNEKVYSAFPSVELRNGCLMGIIECQVTKDISDGEIKELKSYLLGQTSDGWGEGFEQQEISTDNKSIYCSFYTGSADWEVERESDQDISEDNDMDMEM